MSHSDDIQKDFKEFVKESRAAEADRIRKSKERNQLTNLEKVFSTGSTGYENSADPKDSENFYSNSINSINSIPPDPGAEKRILGRTYLHSKYKVPVIWDDNGNTKSGKVKNARWICEPHKISLLFCKDCNVGNYFCSHLRQRWRCTICEGAARICTHGLRQERCADCDGSELCTHGLRVHSCATCNPEEVLIGRVRTRIWNAIKHHKKEYRTLDLLGCTVGELKTYLESLWEPGMTWETYGLGGWEIDHRKPCKAFDLSDPAEQIACFHYTNLQPMWSGDNQSKNDFFDEATFTHTWTGTQWVLKT
jgi:hypothetical protein